MLLVKKFSHVRTRNAQKRSCATAATSASFKQKESCRRSKAVFDLIGDYTN